MTHTAANTTSGGCHANGVSSDAKETASDIGCVAYLGVVRRTEVVMLASRRRAAGGWHLLEECHLFAQLLGIDRREVEQPLQLAYGRGGMSGKMVVGVTIDRATLGGELRDDAGPQLQLARP